MYEDFERGQFVPPGAVFETEPVFELSAQALAYLDSAPSEFAADDVDG